jgi:hypothetical protein
VTGPALVIGILALGSTALVKPPPAWIETSSGRHRLGLSSYYWHAEGPAVCADYVRPRCHDGRTPTIRIRRGETVRFELGFTPESVSVAFLDGNSSLVTLGRSRRPRWKITRPGAVALFATARRGGDASYTACVVFRR